jgi:hypothetical protein
MSASARSVAKSPASTTALKIGPTASWDAENLVGLYEKHHKMIHRILPPLLPR